MAEKATNALLPAGLRDVLPPEAAHEARVVEALLSQFAAHGYERVRPPLVEFEESLLAGSGAAMGSQTFRLMDPVSQRMMGVRADITLQIARIAATRLAGAPRPLRLSYAGEPATGFTLAMETVLQALPDPEPARRLFVPIGTPPETARRLRIDGWAVVAGLAPIQDAKREAARLGCAHALVDGKIVATAK